jgi:predicted DNA-binding protein (MmcQ/YjbR family)
MNLEALQALCMSFPKATQDIKWEHDLCLNIGGKMFLVTGPENVPVSASFKATDEDFELLIAREGFIPAPYLARHKWVHVDDLQRLSKQEWEHFAQQAYTLVKAKLPKKILREIESE